MLLLTLAVFVAISVPAYITFDWMVDKTIIKLGTLFAEKQVLFDRYRGMETLLREASLAQTLARSPALLSWAADEGDPDKAARGLAELEHYRLAFKDKSYFFVIDTSGRYYFNDKDNSYDGAQLRYQVERDNPRDGWYFKTIATGPGCQLNVDHDDHLAVTKVWINCVVSADGHVLGVVGTGIDLSDFIREVVDIQQTGVESIFIDRSGAIQAHRDPRMVDFHSLTKDTKNKKTVFLLLDNDKDRNTVRTMMDEIASGTQTVESNFVHIDGRKVLAGVSYLDQLGWYNVTLMDVDRIIEADLFRPIAILLACVLAIAALLMTLLFKRVVLDRLARLELAVHEVEAGRYDISEIDHGTDEIGRLSRAFGMMAGTVGTQTQRLEELVRERTEKLDRLARLDPLTEALNRRGFLQAWESEHNRANRQGKTLGLLLIDIDLLKTVNDGFGHQAGDLVLVQAVRRLTTVLRSYDVCARWGGDEFAILISECSAGTLRVIAEKLVAAVGGPPFVLDSGQKITVTISIGACLVDISESIEAVAAKADDALYVAKGAGRNRAVIFGEQR